MTKRDKKINKKIAVRRKKLIRACLAHDPKKQLKQRQKLIKLFLQQQDT